MADSSNNIPHWLDSLFKEKFFDPCLTHKEFRRHEKTIFCLDCCSSFCPYCICSHLGHKFLQVRRYVYHEAVKIQDMEKLINCSFVQSYKLNRAKVVFLKKRAQCRPFRNFGNFCSSCDRALQNEYSYCSIACKVKKLVESEGGLAGHLYKCDFLPPPLNSDDFEEDQLSPESILDEPTTGNSSSFPTSNSARVECLKRKQKEHGAASPRNSVGMHRRKGVPTRSPYY